MEHHKKKRMRSERNKLHHTAAITVKPPKPIYEVSLQQHWPIKPAIITSNRLTMRLGLFNQGKQSKTVSRAGVAQTSAAQSHERNFGALNLTDTAHPASGTDHPSHLAARRSIEAGHGFASGTCQPVYDCGEVSCAQSPAKLPDSPDIKSVSSYLTSVIDMKAWFPTAPDYFQIAKSRLSALYLRSNPVNVLSSANSSTSDSYAVLLCGGLTSETARRCHQGSGINSHPEPVRRTREPSSCIDEALGNLNAGADVRLIGNVRRQQVTGKNTYVIGDLRCYRLSQLDDNSPCVRTWHRKVSLSNNALLDKENIRTLNAKHSAMKADRDKPGVGFFARGTFGGDRTSGFRLDSCQVACENGRQSGIIQADDCIGSIPGASRKSVAFGKQMAAAAVGIPGQMTAADGEFAQHIPRASKRKYCVDQVHDKMPSPSLSGTSSLFSSLFQAWNREDDPDIPTEALTDACRLLEFNEQLMQKQSHVETSSSVRPEAGRPLKQDLVTFSEWMDQSEINRSRQQPISSVYPSSQDWNLSSTRLSSRRERDLLDTIDGMLPMEELFMSTAADSRPLMSRKPTHVNEQWRQVSDADEQWTDEQLKLVNAIDSDGSPVWDLRLPSQPFQQPVFHDSPSPELKTVVIEHHQPDEYCDVCDEDPLFAIP